MKNIADEYGILLKEHNCDYLNFNQISLRKKYGIDAINIAPELGVIQTNLVYTLSKYLKMDKNWKISKACFKKINGKSGILMRIISLNFYQRSLSF